MSLVQVFDEVRRLGGVELPLEYGAMGCAAGNISAKDLEEVRSLSGQPPPVVQRTLELMWMILNATRAAKHLEPPDWTSVRRTLSDAEFQSRVLEYDVQQLRAAPELCDYLVHEYFNPNDHLHIGPSVGAADRRRRPARRHSYPLVSTNKTKEPLTFQRVYRASRAAAALFGWCAEVVDRAAILDNPPSVASHATEAAAGPSQSNNQQSMRPHLCMEEPSEVVPVQKVPPFDHFFETLISFQTGRDVITSNQVEQLREVVATMRMRPTLQLELSVCIDPCRDTPDTGEQRLYGVQLFLEAEGIAYSVGPAEEHSILEKRSSSGISCRFRMDDDIALRNFFSASYEGGASPNAREAARWLSRNFRMS